jgi:hypothetical protein
VDGNLNPSTAYAYTVCAYDGVGTLSLLSSPLTISTQAPMTIAISPGSVMLRARGRPKASRRTANQAVTWSLGSPVGTISPAGMYKVPDHLTVLTRVPVIAMSVTDSTVAASETVTILPSAGGGATASRLEQR